MSTRATRCPSINPVTTAPRATTLIAHQDGVEQSKGVRRNHTRRYWVVERSFAWMARFRRLARDDERLPESLAGLHFVAFAILMVKRFVTFMVEST